MATGSKATPQPVPTKTSTLAGVSGVLGGQHAGGHSDVANQRTKLFENLGKLAQESNLDQKALNAAKTRTKLFEGLASGRNLDKMALDAAKAKGKVVPKDVTPMGPKTGNLDRKMIEKQNAKNARMTVQNKNK
jgi:hypothetical protein